MNRYSHLEPGMGGPTLWESIAVAMLFIIFLFLMLGCALGELTVRLFPPYNRHNHEQ